MKSTNFALPQNYLLCLYGIFIYMPPGMTLIALVILVTHAHGFLFGQKNGMFWRIIATTAIHKKVKPLF